MRKSRRLLAMLLAVMMAISALPLGIFAEDKVVWEDEQTPEVSVLPTVGFYDACQRSNDTWLGNGSDHVIQGAAGETKTVYCLWDTGAVGTVASVSLSYEDVDGDGDVLLEVPLEKTADTLAAYGVTVTSQLGEGYIQVETGFSDSSNLEIFLMNGNGELYSAHLSIDEKQTSDGGEEEEQPVIREVDLYWSKFHGMYEGAPDYAADSMWDEVGQDINAVFLFWDGETFSEVPFAELSFPKGLTYSQNKEYANAVYMVFDKALVGDITYTRDGQTYAFPLEVEDLTGEEEEVTLPEVAYFSAPERTAENWIKKDAVSGVDGEFSEAFLMWDTTIFTVDEQSDVKVYLVKNGDKDVAVDHQVWDEGVDHVLYQYGVSLNLDPDDHHISVFADYSSLNGTLDFSLTLTDRNGDIHEAQLSIDKIEEEASLKWCWVNRENGVYLPQTDYLSNEIWMELGDEQLMAVYLERGEEKTLIPYEDLIFEGEGFSTQVNEEDERFFDFCAESSGTGGICCEVDGTTYSFPVEVALPHLGFFSRPERCDDAFVGNTLTYTGENDVYYVILRDEKVIQSVEIVWQDQTVTDDQIRVVIADDGTYAALHLGENLQLDKTHNITVQYSNGSSSRVFRFRNGKAGLRWCWVNGNSDDLTADIDNLRTELNRGITPYGSNWMAFCFEENGQVELLDGEDLNFPDLVDVERINENQPQYLGVQFRQFGTGEITYERNGVIYRLPVEVTLPGLGFYHEPVRSQETYAEPLVLDGKDEAGNAVETETFYLMLENDYEVIDLKFSDGQPDYVSYEIMDGYAAVTIGADADEEWQNIEVTYGDRDVPNWTNTWWAGFRVKNESPGLRWCWVNRHNSQYEPQVEDLERKLWLDLGDEARIAVYLQDGEHKTLIPYEELQFEGSCFHDEALSDHEDYFYLYGDTCGQGKVVYEAGGITYSLPVEAGLPHLGFYTSAERSEETFAGTELAYTGDNDVYYVILGNDYPIQRAEILLDDQPVDEDEIKIEISADGTYATVTLGEEVRDGESYSVSLHYNNGNYSGRGFRVLDNRPGLRWVYLRWDDNDNLYEDMEDVRSDLDYSMNNSVRAAFYFVDGDKWERLSPDQLRFPDFLKLEQMEEHEDYVRVRFRQFGSGEVTYTRDGVTYSIPASVGLPSVSFYSQPVRSEETYLGEELPFDGKDDKGNTAATETFYLMMMDGWEVTEVEFEDGQPDFVSYEIVDGYAAVTVSDGFDGEYYDIRVYAAWENDADRTDDWWANFEVVDERPGLKWVYLRWDDNDNLYENLEDVRSDLDYSMNSSVRAAFYFVDGDKWERLSPEVLQFPDFLTVKQMEESPDYVRVGFDQFGSGEVTYERDGVTYTMPASVSLPGMSYYTEPVRSEATYMGDELIFDGKDEAGNAVTEETFYLMAEDSWNITELEFTDGQPDFVSYEIVDGYAVITISEGFNDEWYEVKAYCQHENDPDNTDWWWADFEIIDNRPGLRWVYLRWDDNDNLYEDMEDVRSDLDYSMNNSVRAAFYFVDGDKWERLSPDQLRFPDFLTVKQMEEGPDYVRVGFDQFGSGKVTYTRDGVTYSMPASVSLPGMGYYTEPVRSEATYMGDELIFDGKDNEGNAVTEETFYLMAQDSWNITELEFTEGQPSFVSYEIVDGYAVITISEGFNDEWYEIKAYCQHENDPDNTDWWWADFEIRDNRPGLKWKWVNFGGDGQFPFVPEDEEFQSVISHRVDSGVTVAVYYVDGDTEVLIPKNKLILPDFVEIEPNTDAEGGDYFFWLSFLAVGEGEITCADYPGCGLPVVSELPFIALYSQPEAKEAYLLNSKNLSLDFSEEAEDGRKYAIAYVVPTEEWYLTGLQMGGNGNDTPMDFLEYTVDEAENYIELKVYDEYVPDWYSMQVFYEREDGREGDRWVEFRLADKPILQWMQVMEADGSYAITGGSRSLSLQPGESQLMAVCYTDNNDMVPLDYEDLIFPDFLSVERLDEDDPTLLRVLCTDLGEGSITSKTYPDLRLRVVSNREVLGYYTLPELNGDALNNRLNSVDGEDIVRWLIWDPAQLPDVTDVTLTLKNEEHTILVDDVRASSADLSQWGITVTLDLEAGHMKLVAKEGDWYNLTAKVWQDEDCERITVNLNSDPNLWRNNTATNGELPTIEYKGVEYTFGIGIIEDNRLNLLGSSSFGSSGGGTHDWQLLIGAMKNADTPQEEEAGEEIMNAISDVQFHVGKYQNFGVYDDQTSSHFYIVDNITQNLNGKTLHGVYAQSEDGLYVYADFVATFTVTLDGETHHFTVNNMGHRLPDRQVELDMTALDTAEELNPVLSSRDNLMNWVKANQPKAYNQYQALKSTEMRAMNAQFNVSLAPTVFEDVIILDVEGIHLNLMGTRDDSGNRTTMPGLWLRNNSATAIVGIDFEAVSGKTMTWGKEKAFTCGILAGGEDNRHGDSYGVHNCTFTGFDYGIRCTEYSFTTPSGNCVFENCKVGYYVDCSKKTGGNANSSITGIRFVNCGTAIRIKALPTYISPYDLVISNNDFINNDWDIDLSVRGRFFFNGNYYGETADGSVPEVRADCNYRTARVHGRGYATIIVNPRWQLPCTFAGPNKLVMDTHKGLNNYMINEDADEHPIDSKTLAYDLGLYTEAELMRIIMTDDSENTLGTWSFSGTKDSESLSLLDAAAEADDTFNAELIFGEDAEGSTTVTIQDSSILSGGNVKLTVPCTFLDAKVTVNGRAVDASVANGQVTFTVIGGGTYVIHEVELEEIEDAFITGGAAESNPDAGDEPVTQPKAEVDMGWYNYDHSESGEDTAPKFATVTTEDQQVAKEIDPDADLDQVVGDEKVEEKTETTQIVTVQAIYQAPAAAEPGDTVSDVVVLLVLYDKTGQMIAMHQQVAQQSDGTRVITVQCDAALLSSNAVSVKAFVISASGDMRPLAPVPFSQTLTFGAN